jgi:hypothetical protein
MEILPDKIWTAELPDRLGVSRSRVYQLIEKLNVKTNRVGNKAYITREDYLRIQEAHNYIKDGKNLAEYLLDHPQEFEPVVMIDETPEVGISRTGSSDVSNSILLPVLEMVLEKLDRATPALPPNPVEELKSRLETLAICSRDKVVLSNQELSTLLGLNHNTIRKQEKFSQYGYSFTRTKEGRNIFWTITHNSPE